MSSNWQKSGPNYVPAYQASGIPYVTSSAASEVPGIDGNSASSEPIAVHFPYVTKFVTIRNTGINELRVGFSVRGMFAPTERQPASLDSAAKPDVSATDHKNYFLIPTGSGDARAGSVQSFEIRCKSIYFMSDATDNSPGAAQATSFSLLAGLTTIPSEQFPILTGSVAGTGSFEGVG